MRAFSGPAQEIYGRRFFADKPFSRDLTQGPEASGHKKGPVTTVFARIRSTSDHFTGVPRSGHEPEGRRCIIHVEEIARERADHSLGQQIADSRQQLTVA